MPGALVHGESGSQLIHGDFNSETPATEMLTPDQIDAILMRHDQVSFWWIVLHRRIIALLKIREYVIAVMTRILFFYRVLIMPS